MCPERRQEKVTLWICQACWLCQTVMHCRTRGEVGRQASFIALYKRALLRFKGIAKAGV